jgi:hypothetical protein
MGNREEFALDGEIDSVAEGRPARARTVSQVLGCSGR